MADDRLEYLVDMTENYTRVQTIMEALDSVKRLIVTHEGCAEQLREAVEAEGLSGVVEVVGTKYLPERTAYIVRPGITAELMKSEQGGSYVKRWIADYDKGDRG